ncbi:MAG: VOC family protein, partial [Marinirhabdus sp.]|nr:VOC family protein [Marinirhabdus sp.]
AKWYENVLGLKKYRCKEWGDYPIFMLKNKTGVTLFPANTNDTVCDSTSKNVKIDHFAFNVTRENFENAKRKFTELQIDFNVQDHHFFHSIYLKDPDNHTVELTTLVVDEDTFY